MEWSEAASRRPTPCFLTFAQTRRGGAPKEWQRDRDKRNAVAMDGVRL